MTVTAPLPIFTADDLLRANLPGRADRTALVLGDAELTYGDLDREVNRVAAWLAAVGVRRGDRVGIHLHKSFEEVIATFAASRCGAVFVNLNYQWRPHQLDHIQQDCGLRVLVTDRPRAEQLAASGLADRLDAMLVRGGAATHRTVTLWDSLPAGAGPPDTRAIGADLAALLYTSGSTGRPKGVMFTHTNIVDGARSVASYLANTEADRVLGLLPLSFDYGLSQVTTMFLVGGAVVLQPVMMPAEIVATVLAQRVTGLAAVPTVWIQLVRYLQDLRDERPALPLRYVTNSGGKIPTGILEAMPAVFPEVALYLMYGLTEAFRSTYLPPDLFHRKMGAIGRAIPNVEIYVVDPEGGLCGPGEVGELIHRGSLISRGYWGDPELTAKRLRPSPHLRPLIGDEPVLHSGDLVRWDDEGFLWFVGRADSMIKCSGYRISPTEVEDVVHLNESVGDAVAFGVDDDTYGQVVHVAVAARDGHELDVESLHRFCRRSMPTYMVPARIWAWAGPMPRTANGKTDRPAVIRACREGDTRPAVRAPTREE
jgi:acyl-CoA ligase (AMP-forming) (exosortase A-associated)